MKPKKITSIEAWSSCFHVFVIVDTKQFPHEAPALMKYGEIIQDLSGKGHNWRFYDENFHFLRQAHGPALPWDRIHGELCFKSQLALRRLSQPTPTLPVKGKADVIPKGYCFRFHKERKCPLAVCTNIFATSVTAHTQLRSAIIVPLPKPPVSTPICKSQPSQPLHSGKS